MTTSTFTFKNIVAAVVIFATLFVSSVALIAPMVFAQSTPHINYQGKLTDTSGLAVPNGQYNMRFWLVTTPSIATTSAVWTESLTGVNRVTVTNGLFSVMLGSSTPLTSVDFNQALYLAVEIGGSGSPSWDGEMSPRKVIGTVPAAFEAKRLGGVASTSFLRNDQVGSLTATSSNSLLTLLQGGAGAILRLFGGATEVFSVLSNGNVGIGTSTPAQSLSVAGNALFTGITTLASLTATNATTTNLTVTGALRDSANAAGTFGQILMTTATSTRWTATSSLGFSNSFSNSSQLAALLSDETGTGAVVFNTAPAFAGTSTFNGLSATNLFATGTVSSTNANFTSATTTNLATTRLNINGDSFTDLTGSGLIASSNALTCATASTTGFGCLLAADWNTFTGKVSSSSIDTSAELSALVTDETGTGALVFATAPTFAGMTATGASNFALINASTTNATTTNSLTLNVTGVSTLASLTTTNATATNLTLTGTLRDSANATGTSGMLLLSTGTSTRWTATTSLGFASTFSNSAQLAALLSDETGTGASVFNTGATLSSTTLSGTSYFSGNVGIGTTTPLSKLSVLSTGEQLRLSYDGSNYSTLNTSAVGNLILSSTNKQIYLGDSSANAQDLNFYQGSNGLFGNTASIRADWNDFYLTNNFGRVVIERADTEARSLAIQEANAPYERLNWWYDGSSNTGTGMWMHTGANAGNMNFKLGEAVGTSNFNILDNNETNRFTVNSLGKVGIGTSSPGYRLHVVGTNASATELRVSGTNSSGNWLSYWNTDGSNPDTGARMVVAEQNIEGLNNGLYVGGDRFNGTASYVIGSKDTTPLSLYTSGLSRMTIASTGNVGIGTSSPSAKLTVVGDLRVTGRFADSASSTGALGSVLTATASGTAWVATSSLGISTGNGAVYLATTSTWTNGFLARVASNGTVDSVATSSLGLSAVFSNSAQLAALLSNETGTGAAVFATAPTFAAMTASGVSNFTTLNATTTTASTSNVLTLNVTGVSTLASLTTTNATATNLTVFGALRDSANAIGTNGMVLLSTGTSTRWTATSSLGISGGAGASTFIALSDTDMSSYTANRLIFTNSGATGLTDSESLTFDGTNLGLSSSNGIAFGGTRFITASSGNSSIAFGKNAGYSMLGDNAYNVSIGEGAAQNTVNPTASFNNVIGWGAGFNNASYQNNMIGKGAGEDNTGNDNNFMGTAAGGDNTGTYNNIFGYAAGALNTAGWNNIMGYSAGQTNSGEGNNMMGYLTGTNNSGNQNNLFGEEAGRYNSGFQNNILGSYTGMYNNGAGNNLMGAYTAQYLQAEGSTIIGSYAFRGGAGPAYTANNNTVLGFGAGQNAISAADNNLLLGYQAGYNLTSGANNIAIGYDVHLPSAGGNGQLNIGNLIFGTGLSATATAVSTGNIGIGTTTPEARLTLQRTAISGTTTALIDQYLGLANTSNGAAQFGNRMTMVTTNTATTTIVGSIFRITDSTTYGNTLRGLEVQAQRGTNTLGENTAISGFGRTFGVRGTTEGDAGAVFEPAGVYGETKGTTQGNALRGYSSTITTAAMLQLFQDTSTFSGTGLLMNFGNTTGSFSSSSSRFLDLKVAGTSRFMVNASGTVTIGDGINVAGLQIGKGGLCVDSDGSCTASTTGRISATFYHTGNSDLAEMYFSNENLKTGEIVYLKGGLSVGRATTNSKDAVIGVVSTQPGLVLGADDDSLSSSETGYPIALSGRVPIKLSTENGPIKKGDQIMLSSIPGVGMKASSTGMVVGVALEDFDETRAYSETFVNQFGENLIEPEHIPVVANDPRINDGCYFGGGEAAGEEPCIPLLATSSEGVVAEAEGIAVAEAKARALRQLALTNSHAVTLENGQSLKVGQVVIFVNLSYRYFDEERETMFATLMSAPLEAEPGERVLDRVIELANSFINGVLKIFKLEADEVKTGVLCIGRTCVDETTLKLLLDEQNLNSTPPNNNDEGEVDKGSPDNSEPPDVITDEAGDDNSELVEEEPAPVVEETPSPAEPIPTDPEPLPEEPEPAAEPEIISEEPPVTEGID